MTIQDRPVVIEMPSTYVSPDGSFAEMTLKNSDGTTQIIRFSPDTMVTFVNRVFELFLNHKIQKESILGRVDVQALPVVITSAQETVDGKAVILHFRLQSGLPVAFAIQPEEADQLHKQLGKAVKKAKQQYS